MKHKYHPAAELTTLVFCINLNQKLNTVKNKTKPNQPNNHPNTNVFSPSTHISTVTLLSEKACSYIQRQHTAKKPHPFLKGSKLNQNQTHSQELGRSGWFMTSPNPNYQHKDFPHSQRWLHVILKPYIDTQEVNSSTEELRIRKFLSYFAFPIPQNPVLQKCFFPGKNIRRNRKY